LIPTSGFRHKVQGKEGKIVWQLKERYFGLQ
jgi:hypothetical protein